MFCNKCGAQMPDDATFCGKCSAPVSNTAQATSQTKSKNQKPIIIGLSVAIVVLLIPLIILIVKMASGNGSENTNNPDFENIPTSVTDEVSEKEFSTEESKAETTSPTTSSTIPQTTKPASTKSFDIDNTGYYDEDFPSHPSENLLHHPGYGIMTKDASTDTTVTFYVYYTDPESLAVRRTEDITVNLDENHSANFNWKDSWGNSGTGSIKFTNEWRIYSRPDKKQGYGYFVEAYVTTKETHTVKDTGISLDTTNKKLKSLYGYNP